MLRLYNNIAFFSLRLKGPRSQREAAKIINYEEKVREEDRFKEYYDGTIEMYDIYHSGTRTTSPKNN